MNNNKLLKNTAIFLATVLVTGVIGISSPFTVFAQEYNGYEYEYNGLGQYGYTPDMRYNEPTYVQEYEDDGYEKEYKKYDDDGYEKEYKKYDDDGYEKEYKKYLKKVLKNDDADDDHDDSSNTYIIIRADQKAIASGIKPNVQNCLQINLDALLTSGDEIEDCHNQRDGDTNQSGID
jgi:hypothetical protein